MAVRKNPQKQPPANRRNDNSIKNNDNADPRIVRWTFISAVSTALIFIATAVFAYFAYGQWDEMRKSGAQTERAIGAANRLADASNQQAKAIIASQSPIFGVVNIQLGRTVDKQNGPSRFEAITDNIPADNSKIFITIENVGAVSGVIKELCVDWRITDTLPGQPAMCEKKYGFNYAVKAGETHGFYTAETNIVLTKSQREEMEIYRQTLWVYGYISYQDLFGDLIDMGIIAQWEVAERTPAHITGFIPNGPPNYVYMRKRETQP